MAPELRDKALRLLARREHSRAELAAKLGAAGASPEDIAALLDELEAKNWLSDRRYAESYVADKRGRYGRIKLGHELRRHGVAETLIEEVLGGMDEGEAARLKAVWERKFGALPGDARERARQQRFLLGRGFSSAAVGKLLGGEQD